MTPLFAKTLTRARQVKSYEIAPIPSRGWEVSERIDHDLIQQRRYSDWHRVERAMSRFTREISELRRQGWIEA